MSQQESKFELGIRSIVGFMLGIGFLVLLFFLLRGIFNIFLLLAPFLIVGALLINYRTVVDFIKWIWNLLNTNILAGLLCTVLIVIGYPVVSAYLFGKSIFDRKVRAYMKAQEKENEFVEYEDLSDDFELQLKQLEKRAESRENEL